MHILPLKSGTSMPLLVQLLHKAQGRPTHRPLHISSPELGEPVLDGGARHDQPVHRLHLLGSQCDLGVRVPAWQWGCSGETGL